MQYKTHEVLSKKTTAAYKVKYTIMSKDSKHYLQLVIERMIHCWRRKKQLHTMKYFYLWLNMTKKHENLNASLVGKDETDDGRMSAKEAELLVRSRWEAKMELDRKSRMKKFLARFLGGKTARQLAGALKLWLRHAQLLLNEDMMLNNASVEELKAQVQMLSAELEIASSGLTDLQRQKQIIGKKNMKKIVSMWRNKLKSCAFSSWRINANTLKRQKKLLVGTILRMSNVKMASAIHAWQVRVEFIVRRENLGKKVLLRLLKIKLSAGFRTWTIRISKMKSLENKAMLATTATFYDLESTIALLQEELTTLQGAESLNETLTNKLEEAEAQKQLLTGQLGTAQAEKTKQAQKNARKIIQTLVNKALATTLLAWKQFAHEGKSNKIKMKKFLARIQKAGLFMVFFEWRQFLLEKKRNANIVKKFSDRMKNSTSVRILQNWNKHCKERRKYKTTLIRFTKRMRNSKALSAFISWNEYVNLRKRLKFLASKILNRLENGKLYGAWLQWVNVIEFYHRKESEVRKDLGQCKVKLWAN